MVQISPFRALRPQPDKAEKLISVPYDVVNTEEARAMAEGNPLSFLRVVRSEIEFPPDADPHAPEIYDRARDNLNRLVSSGILFREEQPCLYVYRINKGDHQQTGLVSRVHADDYNNNRIKKHELTRKDKEEDRTKHVDHLGANTGPVLMTFSSKSVKEIAELLDRHANATSPLYDVTRQDGVRHRIYRIEPGEKQDRVKELFGRLEALYIADGHHRSASAANVCAMRRKRAGKSDGTEDFNWFLSVSFPDEQLRILPYNRVVKDLNGLTARTFLDKLAADFEIADGKQELHMHEMNMYMEGKWRRLRAKEATYKNADEIRSLDVSILQDHVLGPMLGIDDPRTSERIHFVGGIRGDGELERLVDSKGFAVAFSMFPTSTDQLLAIADAGKIMPPKSTWFEPKLCSGFLLNLLE